MFKHLGIPCKVCGRVYRNTKSDREEHDAVCNPTFRHNALKEQIELESRHQEELGYYSKPISSSSTKLLGAYTSKLYQGRSSSDLFAKSKTAVIEKGNNAEVYDTDLDRSIFSSKRMKMSNKDESSKAISEYDIDNESILDKGVSMTLNEVNHKHQLSTTGTTALLKNDVVDSDLDTNSLLIINSRRSRHRNALSSTERTYLGLLKILYSINAPYHAFDTITHWLRAVDKSHLSHSIQI